MYLDAGILSVKWNLATQDLWSKVQPSLSTDVTMLMGRGRQDMFMLSYIILRNNYRIAYVIQNACGCVFIYYYYKIIRSS